jgi:hypothetical protein
VVDSVSQHQRAGPHVQRSPPHGARQDAARARSRSCGKGLQGASKPWRALTRTRHARGSGRSSAMTAHIAGGGAAAWEQRRGPTPNSSGLSSSPTPTGEATLSVISSDAAGARCRPEGLLPCLECAVWPGDEPAGHMQPTHPAPRRPGRSHPGVRLRSRSRARRRPRPHRPPPTPAPRPTPTNPRTLPGTPPPLMSTRTLPAARSGRARRAPTSRACLPKRSPSIPSPTTATVRCCSRAAGSRRSSTFLPRRACWPSTFLHWQRAWRRCRWGSCWARGRSTCGWGRRAA